MEFSYKPHEPSLSTYKKWYKLFHKTQLERIGSPLKVRASKLWYDISDVKYIQTWFCLCVLSVIGQIKHPIISLCSRGLWSSFICPHHEPFAFCPTSTLWLTGQSLGAVSIAPDRGVTGETPLWPFAPYLLFLSSETQTFIKLDYVKQQQKSQRREGGRQREGWEREERDGRQGSLHIQRLDHHTGQTAGVKGHRVMRVLSCHHKHTLTPTHTTWWVGLLLNCDKVINVHRKRERVIESQSKHLLQCRPLQTFCSCRLQARRAQSWHFPSSFRGMLINWHTFLGSGRTCSSGFLKVTGHWFSLLTK